MAENGATHARRIGHHVARCAPAILGGWAGNPPSPNGVAEGEGLRLAAAQDHTPIRRGHHRHAVRSLEVTAGRGRDERAVEDRGNILVVGPRRPRSVRY